MSSCPTVGASIDGAGTDCHGSGKASRLLLYASLHIRLESRPRTVLRIKRKGTHTT